MAPWRAPLYNAKLAVAGGTPRPWFWDEIYIVILNENSIGVAGAPPPSLVLEHFCLLIK